MKNVSLTLDLEDHRPDATWPRRYPEMTRRILDLLDEHDARASVYVVGTLAREDPDLVAEVARRGHEVGLHGWEHVPLTSLDPPEFAEGVRRGKQLLEDLIGAEVVGYRAPTFSLVPESAWATEILAEAGFKYSSSILAARSPLFGWPGAPRSAFRWPSGLLELPAPLLGMGSLALPVLGGVYLRTLPWPVVAAGRRWARTPVPWIYCHPYDFDTGEEYWVVPDAGRLGSRLLWYGRKRMVRRVRRLLRNGAGPPLGEQLLWFGDAPTFDPVGTR